MDEHEIRRIMSQDLSEGTEEFRDELLKRCLDVLGLDEDSDFLADAGFAALSDDDLEMLAAAGDAMSVPPEAQFGENNTEEV